MVQREVQGIPSSVGLLMVAPGSKVQDGLGGMPFLYEPPKGSGDVLLLLHNGAFVMAPEGLRWTVENGFLQGKRADSIVLSVWVPHVAGVGHDAEDLSTEVSHMLALRTFS